MGEGRVMEGNCEQTYNRLLDKSSEAFVLAIELYNRPSIKYRVEGFSFFICNAWELMLKAKLIADRGISAVYYRDNTDRTITLGRYTVPTARRAPNSTAST